MVELDPALSAGSLSSSALVNKPEPWWRRRQQSARQIAWWLVVAGTLAALCIAISGQSYWIDEANAVWRAEQPDFWLLVDRMLSDTGSDAQMPLFLVAIWTWEKAVGPGEVAIRAMNLLWIIPGIYIFAGGRIERLLVAGTSAFLWFYLDEARPYGMQIGASLIVFGLLERAIEATRVSGDQGPLLRPHEMWLLAFELVALAGSSLLGAIWAAAALGGAVFAGTWRRHHLAATHVVGPVAMLVLVLVPLGLYYLWTVLGGAGGTKVAVTDVRNLVFSGYELLGFAGLGPGRTELRAVGEAAFAPHAVVLGAYTSLVGVVTLAGMVRIALTVPRRTLAVCAIAFTAAAFLILTAGYQLHWRVVGRHLAPALPAVLAVQAAGVTVLWRSAIGRFVVLGFLAMALASAASIRFAPRHAKDDYRSAAEVARLALSAGERVWWNADAFGAFVYHVPLGKACNEALYISELQPSFVRPEEAPTLVITSKPDIYDPSGALATFLSDKQFYVSDTFQAFQIWRGTEPPGTTTCSLSE